MVGSYDPVSGRKHLKGRGTNAIGWETQIKAINTSIAKLKEEKDALAGAEQKLIDAKKEIENLTNAAKKTAQNLEQGGAHKVSLLFQLLFEEPSLLLVMLVSVILTLIPDLVMWQALMGSTQLRKAYDQLIQLQDQQFTKE